jgi:hypothetical protein
VQEDLCHHRHSNLWDLRDYCGAPRLYSRGPSCFFGVTRRSMSSFAEASEDTRCAFLHGLIAVASCEGG